MKIGGGKRGAFPTKLGISEEKYSNQGRRTNGVRSLLTLQAKISNSGFILSMLESHGRKRVTN